MQVELHTSLDGSKWLASLFSHLTATESWCSANSMVCMMDLQNLFLQFEKVKYISDHYTDFAKERICMLC
jgi:hypothetical protein